MAVYDTTATCEADSFITEATAATNYGTSQVLWIGGAAGNRHRIIVSFKNPQAPLGADALTNVYLTLTSIQSVGGGTISVPAYKISNLWTETGVTWNNYAGGQAWTAAGGDLGGQEGQESISGALSSYTVDLTAAGVSWGGNGTVLLRDAGDTTNLVEFNSVNSGAAYSALPHITCRYINNPPPAVNDLQCTPDLSLSESTATYRRRTLLKWSAVNVPDFSRYRIRHGNNVSDPASMTHLAFVNSRASNSYLDPNVYGGATQYYVIYAEDNMNKSASTNCNVSNVASFQVPLQSGTSGVQTSASVLGPVTIQVIPGTMSVSKLAKIWWGDGSYSLTSKQTPDGTSFTANHRYSKASTSYNVRTQVESIYGFREGLTTMTFTIHNLGPIARLVASPSTHMEMRTYPEWARDYRPASYEPPEDGRHYDLHLERKHRRNTLAYNPVFSGDPPRPIDIRTVAAGFLCPCGEAPHTVLTDLAQYEDPPRLLFAENLKIHLQRFGGPEAIDAMDRSWFRSRIVDDEPLDLAEAKLVDSAYSWEASHPDSVIDRDSLHDYAVYCQKRGIQPSLADFLRHAKPESAFRIP